MSKEVIMTCDLCRKKDARELPVWFEWEKATRGVDGIDGLTGLFEQYISGVLSNGWARYHRVIYLCKEHHELLDKKVTEFVKENSRQPEASNET